MICYDPEPEIGRISGLWRLLIWVFAFAASWGLAIALFRALLHLANLVNARLL